VTEGVVVKKNFSLLACHHQLQLGTSLWSKTCERLKWEAKFKTRMATLLDAPPVMVAGTSPTATPWNFVVAV